MVITELQISDLPKDLQTEIKDKQHSLRLYDFKVLKCTKEVYPNGYITFKAYCRSSSIVYLYTQDYLQDKYLKVQRLDSFSIKDLKIFLKLIEGEA
ncbi:hypothetical protein D3C76_1527640 [compost metagenome]